MLERVKSLSGDSPPGPVAADPGSSPPCGYLEGNMEAAEKPKINREAAE